MIRDVWRNTGQFEVGAVDHCAFAAAFLWTNLVLEALPIQTTTIVLLTCEERWEEQKKRKNRSKEIRGKKQKFGKGKEVK